MKNPELESKRIFLIASRDAEFCKKVAEKVEKQIKNTTIFSSTDGTDALFKVSNVLPHVAILDAHLDKVNGFGVAEKLLNKKSDQLISIILLASVPDKDQFVDEVVTGQVQFVDPNEVDAKLSSCITKALNKVSSNEASTYLLKFLSANEVLFKEGDPGGSVFLVKNGELKALKKNAEGEVVLGVIKPGEFVGEMSYINNETRNATVTAASECELIEIPAGTLDLVLFSKPAWSKALMTTLSKRLKASNSMVANKI